MNASELKRCCQNRLLALLSEADLERIAPYFSICEFDEHDVLVKRHEELRHIYFPNNLVGSIISQMEDGSSVEIGAVGNDGMSSVPALLGGTVAHETLICQIAGNAARVEIQPFLEEVDTNKHFRHVMQLYGQAYLAQIAQSVSCNRFHSIEQRFARWLLMSLDRVRRNEFFLTQESMAIMLGVHRPSVSQVAQRFQETGAIEYSRGKISVLDRQKLESQSCECYATTKKHFDGLLGIHAG